MGPTCVVEKRRYKTTTRVVASQPLKIGKTTNVHIGCTYSKYINIPLGVLYCCVVGGESDLPEISEKSRIITTYVATNADVKWSFLLILYIDIIL